MNQPPATLARRSLNISSTIRSILVPVNGRDHRVAVEGSIEVGVDFPQSREFQPGAQFADREGTEPDLMLTWLNLTAVRTTAVLKEEHQMGDVLVAEAIRYLPGVEHQASPSLARDHPVAHLDDLAPGMEPLPVAGINHHVSAGTGHPPQPRQR